MTRSCPCPGGRQDSTTGELYCPWRAYGDSWTPECCDYCLGELARQEELLGDMQRDEPREGEI